MAGLSGKFLVSLIVLINCCFLQIKFIIFDIVPYTFVFCMFGVIFECVFCYVDVNNLNTRFINKDCLVLKLLKMECCLYSVYLSPPILNSHSIVGYLLVATQAYGMA